MRFFYQFSWKLGNNGNQENQGNVVTLEDLKEGFNSLNIEIDNDQFISKILSCLKDHGIHDKRKDSIDFVMKYAKKFSPKMTILNKDFLDALKKRIEGKTLLGEILIDDEDDCTDSDVEPPSKRPKRSSKKKQQLSNKTSNKKKKKGGNKPKKCNLNLRKKETKDASNKKLNKLRNSNSSKKKKIKFINSKPKQISQPSQMEKKNSKLKKSSNTNSSKKDANTKLKKSNNRNSSKKEKKNLNKKNKKKS